MLLALLVIISSCQKDEDIPGTDYSIESSGYFQVISTHPNGWIKEGMHGYLPNEPDNEFEYFENGFIKSAKIYSNTYNQHMYMDVNRDENNQPVSSKYYTREGDLWFETQYLNGFTSEKKVYSEKGTSVYKYEEGNLVSVKFTRADGSGSSSTVFDKAAGTRTVTIMNNGETVLEETYAFTEGIGASMQTSNQVPLANPFTDPAGDYREMNEAFSANSLWANSTDPIFDIKPFRNYSDFQIDRTTFATRFAVSSELYQSVIEQYPFAEDEVLTANFQYKEGSLSFSPSIEDRLALMEEMEKNPDLFDLKYGNEFVSKVYYGKTIFMMGALRNVPTNKEAANEIKSLAYKKFNNIIDGENDLTDEELEKLNKVWFEVKFFSTLRSHRNGIVLNDHNDYQQVEEEFNAAESSIIQLEYRSFENLKFN